VGVFIHHLLCPLGVDAHHLVHSGEEALHESVVVGFGSGDVVEVYVDPWHHVELARPARVDLHGRAVAPDELCCCLGPVVVGVNGFLDLLGRADEFAEVMRWEVEADEGPDFGEDWGGLHGG
jgi:hypothetical protein